MINPQNVQAVNIDQLWHRVTNVVEHPNGQPGWWRVTVGCGMEVDLHEEGFEDSLKWKATAYPATCGGCMATSA